MDIRDRNALMQYADEALGSASYSPRKLMLIHSAVGVGASLLVTLANFLLTRQIDTTGGLANLGLRTVLTTIQMLLQYGIMLVLPFWEYGIFYAAIRTCRSEVAGPDTLLRGFRRFGPVLRTMLLQGVIYYLIALGCSYVLIFVVMLSPLAMDLLLAVMSAEAIEGAVGQITTMEELEALLMDEAALNEAIEALMPALMPVILILLAVFCVLYCGVILVVSYRLRMMPYLILDEQKRGAIEALRMSNRMTKGWKMDLFKLDLRFWWYYALQAVTVVLCYAPELLSLAGITLPISADAAFWLFYVIYAVAQLALYVLARPKVETVFAAAYDSLLPQQ